MNNGLTRITDINVDWSGLWVYCDGTFGINLKVAGVGVVSKNSADLCLCLLGKVANSDSPFMAEALAVMIGLKWCINSGHDSVRFRSSICLHGFKLLIKKNICPEWECLNLVEKIVNLSKTHSYFFEWILISWIMATDRCAQRLGVKSPSALANILAS